jgi:hypothetical protein
LQATRKRDFCLILVSGSVNKPYNVSGLGSQPCQLASSHKMILFRLRTCCMRVGEDMLVFFQGLRHNCVAALRQVNGARGASQEEQIRLVAALI